MTIKFMTRTYINITSQTVYKNVKSYVYAGDLSRIRSYEITTNYAVTNTSVRKSDNLACY